MQQKYQSDSQIVDAAIKLHRERKDCQLLGRSIGEPYLVDTDVGTVERCNPVDRTIAVARDELFRLLDQRQAATPC